ALEHVVRKCLEKDPDDRWQTARDVMGELQWVEQGGSSVGTPAAVSSRRRSRERTAWGAFAIASLAAIGFAAGFVMRAPKPAPTVRFSLVMPDTMRAAGMP